MDLLADLETPSNYNLFVVYMDVKMFLLATSWSFYWFYFGTTSIEKGRVSVKTNTSGSLNNFHTRAAHFYEYLAYIFPLFRRAAFLQFLRRIKKVLGGKENRETRLPKRVWRERALVIRKRGSFSRTPKGCKRDTRTFKASALGDGRAASSLRAERRLPGGPRACLSFSARSFRLRFSSAFSEVEIGFSMVTCRGYILNLMVKTASFNKSKFFFVTCRGYRPKRLDILVTTRTSGILATLFKILL